MPDRFLVPAHPEKGYKTVIVGEYSINSGGAS